MPSMVLQQELTFIVRLQHRLHSNTLKPTSDWWLIYGWFWRNAGVVPRVVLTLAQFMPGVAAFMRHPIP
jgi:hypothetical protein